ncbi:MAG: DsbA family protein [Kordiimonas sp.]
MRVSILKSVLVLALGLTFMPVSAQDAHDQSSHQGHSHSGQTSQQGALGTSDETPDFTRGDIIYGAMDAPIEIIEYGSLTCPHCKLFMDEVADYLKEDLIPSGKVRLVFRNFVRDQLDLAVSVASRCTSDMELSKDLLESYFDKQVAWATSNDPKTTIFAIAAARGVDEEALDKCLQSREMFEHVIGIAKVGHEKYQIQATPTVIMNGEKVTFKGYDDLRAQINAAVAAN